MMDRAFLAISAAKTGRIRLIKHARYRYFPQLSTTGYPDHGEPQGYLTGLLLMPRLTSFSSGKNTA